MAMKVLMNEKQGPKKRWNSTAADCEQVTVPADEPDNTKELELEEPEIVGEDAGNLKRSGLTKKGMKKNLNKWV